MNFEKLKLAEANFLQQYPGGFAHPDMITVGKKHRVEKMSEFAAEAFSKEKFRHQHKLLENLVKTVSRSSMVSMFEKPKFRDCVNALNPKDRTALVKGYKKLLHGAQEGGIQEAGFNNVLDILVENKIAKWSLITICLVYFRPQSEVFVKPTTAKGIIKHLELDLVYNPRPSWEFYEGYRRAINNMKTRVDSSLSPNNAAFTGFLMMSF